MNTLTLKVGQMPGRLVEVIVTVGTSAREVFELAGVEVSNHEVRLDGNKVDLDTTITSGNLLVAMKMIKGNANTIKVGQMPGRLSQVNYEEGETARALFASAGVEVSNHEIRLDGNKIDIDDSVHGGSLLVAMKMIKGNSELYVSELTVDQIENILDHRFPQEIDKKEVIFAGDAVIVYDFVVEREMFDSVYSLVEEIPEPSVFEVADTEEVHECKCNKGRNYIEVKICELEESANHYWKLFKEYDVQIKVLKDVLDNM